MSEINPTVPDHWIQKEPEKFEDLLFVSEETIDSGVLAGMAAKEHIAVYSDEITIEYYNNGEYNFYSPDTAAEATDRIDALMRL